ncbi:MAG: ECF transporter S component [Ruminococcus sp.]
MRRRRNMKTNIQKLALSAMFLALGILLPFLTGQIQQIGNMLLPMHLPVFLCGLICGWQCGVAVGFILPLLRSAMFGAPVLYPMAVAIAFELAAYGLVAGLIYSRSNRKGMGAVYRAIAAAMIAGRAVWGAVEALLLGIGGSAFTWKMFLSGAFLNAIPGIVIQLTLIPAIMFALKKTGIVPLEPHKASESNTER